MSGEAVSQLCEAIEQGDLQTVVHLHRKATQYASLWHIFDELYDGQKPLHYACAQGQMEIVRFLLVDCSVASDPPSKVR